jgi:hypothetical protein
MPPWYGWLLLLLLLLLWPFAVAYFAVGIIWEELQRPRLIIAAGGVRYATGARHYVALWSELRSVLYNAKDSGVRDDEYIVTTTNDVWVVPLRTRGLDKLLATFRRMPGFDEETFKKVQQPYPDMGEYLVWRDGSA